MKKILKYLGIFFQKKGHLVALFTILLFTPQIAFAETLGETTKQTVEATMMTLVSTFIKVLNMLLWPLLLMIGDLMNNDLIVGPGMEERLLSIWQQIRNLVNISFVLVLLIMAFYNVSGFAKEGNFALKTGLPKLIIGLILVNFTFLGGKIVLDISNVATNAVFALPQVVESSGNLSFKETVDKFEQSICTHPDKDGNPIAYVKGTDKDIPPVTSIFCMDDDQTAYQSIINEKFRSKFFSSLSASNAGLIIAVNMGHLADQKYTDVAVTSIGDLLVNQLFSIIMFVIFALSYIVLAIVLVTRVAVLWVALAFSPVMVLFYVVPELKSAAGSAGNVSEQVLTHILAPIKIGVVITVGFMMMDAMNGAIGASTSAISSSTHLSDLSGSLLITGIADLQRLLIAIVSVVIVWKGIFSAVDGTLAAGIAEKIKGVAEGAGSTILGSVKYAPLVPVQVGKKGEDQQGFSWNQLKALHELYLQTYKNNEETEARKFAAGTAIGRWLNMDANTSALKTLANRVAAGSAQPQEIKDALTSGKGINEATAEERGYYAELIKALIERYKPKGSEQMIKDLENAKTGTQLGVILENVMSNNKIVDWSPQDTANMKFGPEKASSTTSTTKAAATTPPPSTTTTPPASTPVDMKATLEAKVKPTLDPNVNLTIPAGLKIDPKIKGFTNLKTQADVDVLETKLKAPDAQKKIDDYIKNNPNDDKIDVTKL